MTFALGRAVRMIALGATALTLLACDTWLGEDKKPLPGTRISVLAHTKGVQPDPGLAGHDILLPPPTPNEDWPQAGGYANHAMHHVAVGEALQAAWTVDIGTGASNEQRLTSPPVIAGGRLFAMDSQARVTAYDAAKGKPLWEADLAPDDDDDHFGGGVAVEGERLYASTGFGQVIALRVDNGKELWRHPMSGPVRAAPTARGNRVFVVSVDNRLHVLDGRNGALLWKHDNVSESAALLGSGSPAEDMGVVVVPFSSGELIAFRVENGRQVWSDSLAGTKRADLTTSLADIRGHPVIDRGMVFASSNSGITVAVDLRTGRRLWEREIGSLETPWVAGNYVFVISADNEVVCLSRRDGRIYWVASLQRWADEEKKRERLVWTGPMLVSDRLIVAGSSGEAYAISPYNGDFLGRIEMPDAVTVAPVVANGTVYFLSDDGRVSAYR